MEDLLIMTPSGGETGRRNAELLAQPTWWARVDGSGVDSSTRFVLQNVAMRSPDASWVRRERLRHLTPEQQMRFLPLAPDFVIELLSPSDRLADTREKRVEYLDNGTRLDNTNAIGGGVLPGFTCVLGPISAVGFDV